MSARNEYTTSYQLQPGWTLQWTFRVQSLDIGFALRRRVRRPLRESCTFEATFSHTFSTKLARTQIVVITKRPWSTSAQLDCFRAFRTHPAGGLRLDRLDVAVPAALTAIPSTKQGV